MEIHINPDMVTFSIKHVLRPYMMDIDNSNNNNVTISNATDSDKARISLTQRSFPI